MATHEAALAFQDALRDDDPAALYDSAPCGYLSITPRGAIVKVNGTFLSWLGYEREDLVGKLRLVDLLSPGGRMYYETHLNPMLHALGRVQEIALDVVRPDGDRVPVLVNAVLDRNRDGDPKVVRLALFDATHRRRYERELLQAKKRAEQSEQHAVRLARTLQQTLIPPSVPVVPGLEVAAAYRPAGRGEEVGGDFYDVFQLADGDWVIALGDVCGKGVEAAVVTSLVRHTIRALAVTTRSPRDVLHQLNAILLTDGAQDRFCTVVVLRLHRTTEGWEVTSSSGGHPLPLLLQPEADPRPIGRPGSVVGAFTTVDYTESSIALGPGDALFVYTDGATEGRQGSDFYGEDRLEAAVAGSGTARETVDRVLQQVLDFQEHLPRDDIALLAVRVPPELPLPRTRSPEERATLPG